jgi:toxin ParE1/3/4
LSAAKNVASYSVSQQAEDDLIDIFEEGVVGFGLDHAIRYHDRLERTFEMLASAPMIARLRHELAKPVRIHPYGAHVIVYSIRGDGVIEIIRVRHGREDWAGDPAATS